MTSANIPQLKYNGNGTASFYVDGKEFFILGGEVHNSVPSDMAYMEEYVWSQIDELPMNALLVPIHWEQVEKVQGEFDFWQPKQVIDRAREVGIRLVFLWFGLWKNGASNYVPAWVKRDCKTYFRARYRGGKASETVSPFCEKAVAADANAFGKFMEFLKEYDGEQQTVIMIQVENEVGFLGDERDFGEEANEKFAQEIPEAVSRIFGVSGTWEQAFDCEAPEYFMSWYMAQAMEKIAGTGKAVYPLPMFANAWLDGFPHRADGFPSGGPIPKVMPVWKEVAKSIDMLCPDIYHKDFYGVCDKYATKSNALFIPETVKGPVSASRVLANLGLYKNTVGISPFGVDDILSAPKYDKMTEDELDGLLFDYHWDRCVPENTEYLRRAYKIIDGIWDLYIKEKDKFIGFARRSANEDGVVIPMGKYDILVYYPLDGQEGKAGSGGFVVPIDEYSFYIVGCNARIRLVPRRGSSWQAEPVGMWEGRFEKGEFIPGRKQNGDRLYQQSRLADMPTVLKYEVGIYE